LSWQRSSNDKQIEVRLWPEGEGRHRLRYTGAGASRHREHAGKLTRNGHRQGLVDVAGAPGVVAPPSGPKLIYRSARRGPL
jgi:hypothetical protein